MPRNPAGRAAADLGAFSLTGRGFLNCPGSKAVPCSSYRSTASFCAADGAGIMSVSFSCAPGGHIYRKIAPFMGSLRSNDPGLLLAAGGAYPFLRTVRFAGGLLDSLPDTPAMVGLV